MYHLNRNKLRSIWRRSQATENAQHNSTSMMSIKAHKELSKARRRSRPELGSGPQEQVEVIEEKNAEFYDFVLGESTHSVQATPTRAPRSSTSPALASSARMKSTSRPSRR